MKLPGLIVPPLTPFDADLRVDEAALARSIDYVVDDAAMIIAAGVEAQEYQYLDLEQREHLIARTIERVDGRKPVAAGVSHPSIKTVARLARFAQDRGAAAIQVLAPLRPFGGVPTQDDLIAYFEAVAAETDLPIMLYLNAGPGADPSPATTVALARIEKVEYLKESSRDLSRVSRLVAEIELAGHARYFTTMQMLLATLALGGSGVTLPPPATKLARLVIDAFVADDFKEAARLQRQFSLWPAKWMHYGLMPTMKASLDILGVPLGDPYPPFKPITGADREALAAYLKTTDLMKD